MTFDYNKHDKWLKCICDTISRSFPSNNFTPVLSKNPEDKVYLEWIEHSDLENVILSQDEFITLATQCINKSRENNYPYCKIKWCNDIPEEREKLKNSLASVY